MSRFRFTIRRLLIAVAMVGLVAAWAVHIRDVARDEDFTPWQFQALIEAFLWISLFALAYLFKTEGKRRR